MGLAPSWLERPEEYEYRSLSARRDKHTFKQQWLRPGRVFPVYERFYWKITKAMLTAIYSILARKDIGACRFFVKGKQGYEGTQNQYRSSSSTVSKIGLCIVSGWTSCGRIHQTGKCGRNQETRAMGPSWVGAPKLCGRSVGNTRCAHNADGAPAMRHTYYILATWITTRVLFLFRIALPGPGSVLDCLGGGKEYSWKHRKG